MILKLLVTLDVTPEEMPNDGRSIVQVVRDEVKSNLESVDYVMEVLDVQQVTEEGRHSEP